MTAIVSPVGVLVPGDINDLTAAGIADGEFAKRVGGVWVGVSEANISAFFNPLFGLTEVHYRLFPVPSGITAFAPTIPSGFKFVTPAVEFTNPTTGTISISCALKRGGSTYAQSVVANVSARGQNSNLISGTNLESGDSWEFTSGASGLTMAIRGWLVPSTYPLKAFMSLLANGSNTIYTCPAGKRAFLWNPSFSAAGAGSNYAFAGGFNATGGTRIYGFHIVPNGGFPTTTNKIVEKSVGNLAGIVPLFQPGMYLDAGESFVVVSDGAGTQPLAMWFWEVVI